jgi:hypothetical protein
MVEDGPSPWHLWYHYEKGFGVGGNHRVDATAVTSINSNPGALPPNQGRSCIRNGRQRPSHQARSVVLCWTYNNVEKCGQFYLACHEWRQMTISDKKYALFKTHFKAEDKNLHRGDTITTDGYHGVANSMTAAAYIATTQSTIMANTQAALTYS